MEQIEQPHGGSINRVAKGEVLNPYGRPKKSFSLLNDQLKKEGYEPLTKGQLLEAYSLLYSVDEGRMQELLEDELQPFAIRMIISDMNEPQTRGKLLNDMRDYLFGKANENIKTQIEFIEQPLFPDVSKNDGNKQNT